MKIFKLHTIAVLALVLSGTIADRLLAQDGLPVATRGTVKVQSRVFNPFDVGPSRLTLKPFGVFSVTPQAVFSPAPAQVPVAVSTQPVATAPASTSPATATSTTSIEVPAPTGGGNGEPGFTTSVVRPPFRPPTRSPWRPPPRPPFFPP